MGNDARELQEQPTDITPSFFVTAPHVLLYATAGSEDWTFVKVSAGDIVLHLLRSAKRCSASVLSTRIVH